MNDPVTESRKPENLTDLAEYETVTETVEQANARRFGMYVGIFAGLFTFLVLLALVA